jgi:tripartite-type tricarboxylate transporter receptor subunit TctC
MGFIARRRLVQSLSLGAAAQGLGPLFAQTLLQKPNRVVVPYAAGGGTDVIGRVLLQNMSSLIGQSFILDNKPGAGTVIGTDFVAKSEPDGHTLLMTSSAVAINASLIKNLPYNTLTDLVSVARICQGPNVFAVKADSSFGTLSDVIKAAKDKPGRLSYASSGNGTAVHLAAELFKLMSGVQIQHIPYKGAGPAYTDLLGGQVDLLVGTAGGVHKFVKSGQMRALALTSTERSKAYPGVPTVGELLPGFVAQVWYGMFAPKGTDPETVRALNELVKRAASLPAYGTVLEQDGLTPSVNTPAEMDLFMRSEVERWRQVIQKANITVD